MKRRHFIKTAGLLGLLTACRAIGLSDRLVERVSTSIPTDSATGLPTFTPTTTLTPLAPAANSPAPPTATATTTPTATATASRTATPGADSPLTTPTPAPGTKTATPTPSPTPTPTPYPPGPPSKLGLFVTRHHSGVLEMVEKGQPALVKTLEFDREFVRGLKASSPATLIVARLHMDQMNLDVDPLPLARSFVEELLPIATDTMRMDAIDGWEAYNEPVADTADKMKRLADFEAERTRLLAAEGLTSVVGNFATGHPPLELWPDFKPALHAIRENGGYLGLHEYSAPIMQFRSGSYQLEGEPPQGDEGWLTLRYRKAYRRYLMPMGYGDIPILMTECGVDGLVQPRPGPPGATGWQEFIDYWLTEGLRPDPPGLYMDQLLWYDANLQQDNYIRGAAIFLAGSNDARWDSYDIFGPGAGRMPDLLTQYLQVHPPR